MSVTYTRASNAAHIEQILALQARNHVANVSVQQMTAQGFVTVRHDPAALGAINAAFPAVIAIADEGVVGYCLIMNPEVSDAVPILAPLFAEIAGLSWNGAPVRARRWCVMGQTCVAEAYRGMGVFDGLYAELFAACRGTFDVVVTEIAERNARSIRAHARVGFERLSVYADAMTGETWHIVAREI